MIDITNEEYQALPEISGSDIVQVLSECPAAWKYKEKKETKAMFQGTAHHAHVLEPDTFDSLYFRDASPDDYEDALVTAKGMTEWLKARGIKGYSGKKKDELTSMVLTADDSAVVFDAIRDKLHADHEGLTPIDAAVYDSLCAMRRQLFADKAIAEILTGAKTEVSATHEGRKARFDIVNNGELWDYKTAVSAEPEEFGKKAHNLGYWVKMAHQALVFEGCYGFYPKKVGFIVQEKEFPYIPQVYQMTEEQLAIGEEQAILGVKLIQSCRSSGSYPAYGGGVRDLSTPGYLSKKYGFSE